LPWIWRVGTLFVSVMVGLTALPRVKNRRILSSVTWVSNSVGSIQGYSAISGLR
jgi:hypothetical protein